MQGSSNNSFIPKRRNSKRQRSKPARKIFLLTIVAYSLLFASLLAAGGTVFYKNYTLSQLEGEAVLLDGAVNTFSVQDFKRVQEFDATLTKAKGRVDNTVSVVSILDELDRVTAQPIQINNLELQRRGDQDLFVTVNFSTETLDAALFQRKILSANSSLFSSVEISEVDIQNGAEATVPDAADVPPSVTFVAEFTTPLAAALYDPLEARRTDVGIGQSTVAPIRDQEILDFSEPEVADSKLNLGDVDPEEIIPLEEADLNETTI